MSGGVDSSVAAYLLKERGFDCTGAMMKLYTNENIGISRDKGCCSLEDARDARSVAYRLGIPFYVFNFAEYFAAEVIQRFVSAYQSGATPNPCIDCNRYLKMESFTIPSVSGRDWDLRRRRLFMSALSCRKAIPWFWGNSESCSLRP